MASQALGPRKGPRNLSPPARPKLLTVGFAPYQGLPSPSFPPPFLPYGTARGAPRGPEGKAWLPKGAGRGGGGSQARWPLPTQPPFLHLVSPWIKHGNKENVWNLSCLLLFLIPSGQGPSPHGQDMASLPALLGRTDCCLGPWRRDSAGVDPWP